MSRIIILQKSSFKKAYKKLHPNQKNDMDDAVRTVMASPDIGTMKKGDLAGVQVYRFKIVNQLTLLAYEYEAGVLTLTLLAFGSHENFYRDLK